MRPITDLREYQRKAINHQCSHPPSALWLEMGIGKTIVTLTSIDHLIKQGFLRAVIVVAPIRVCSLVWRKEATKWAHTSHLTFSLMVGNRDQRTRGLLKKADIYLMNYEGLKWLGEVLHTYYISKGLPIPFDGIVFDEISMMKNSTTLRVKSIMRVLHHFKWTTGLTGTPASNGVTDLHGQYLVLDGGRRLGKSKTQFNTEFCRKEGFRQVLCHDGEARIKNAIGDITLEMSAADYNPLPDLIVNDVMVELPPRCRELYDQMEKDLFIQLDSGTEIELFNQASLTNKCLQFSNGALYPTPGLPLWEVIHDEKLDALEEIIGEAGGKPVLCSYAYRSDAARIMERFKDLDPINLTGCRSEKSLQAAMHRWTTGDCRLMIGHPASMGHGIDGLQTGGNILVWFGLTWSLGQYDQFNARIRRQGQGMPVICHRIMTINTLDQAQELSLVGKGDVQVSLKKAIKQYREQLK